MTTIVEYQDAAGTSHFGDWFDGLAPNVAAKVVTAKAKLQNNIGDVKPVGEGVSECRIDYGPGYRVYFGKDGEALVVLLAGGSKKGQQADIDFARKLWAEYKERKRKAAKDAESKKTTGRPGKTSGKRGSRRRSRK